MDDLGHGVHHDVHVDQLRQVEVHLVVGEVEELVADELQDPGLLGVEEVGHGHGGVEQRGLEQPQQPGLLGEGGGGHGVGVQLLPGPASILAMVVLVCDAPLVVVITDVHITLNSEHVARLGGGGQHFAIVIAICVTD